MKTNTWLWGAVAATMVVQVSSIVLETVGVVVVSPLLAAIGGASLLFAAAGLKKKGIAIGAVAAASGTRTTVTTTTYTTAAPTYTTAAPTYTTAAPSYGSGRRRRAIPSVEDPMTNQSMNILLKMAADLDRKSTCGLRLICELSARQSQEQLAEDEALILSLFGSRDDLIHHQVNNQVSPFQLAEFLGRQSASVSACANTYKRCAYDSFRIMDTLRQNDIRL